MRQLQLPIMMGSTAVGRGIDCTALPRGPAEGEGEGEGAAEGGKSKRGKGGKERKAKAAAAGGWEGLRAVRGLVSLACAAGGREACRNAGACHVQHGFTAVGHCWPRPFSPVPADPRSSAAPQLQRLPAPRAQPRPAPR